jgi:hypothetical protein
MVALTASIPQNPHGHNVATQTQNGDYNRHTLVKEVNNESIINQDSKGYAATATDKTWQIIINMEIATRPQQHN